MKNPKLVLLSLALIVLVAAGVYAYPKLFGGNADTPTRTAEEEYVKRIGKVNFVKPSDAELREMLTETQYDVTQHEGTERRFKNEYWDNYEDGIYVDIVSGIPLFSSKDKFKSGTGWPSFTRPLEDSEVVEKVDRSLFATRTEVRSKTADSHLGHVFDDGPLPTRQRYCLNSAALRFVPKENLEELGYGEYLKDFN